MSWDVVIFNTAEKIIDLEKFNDDKLKPIFFDKIFEGYFNNIKKDGDHREATGEGFTIDYFVHKKPATNCMISLYGEKAIYPIVHRAKINGWQVFDTGLGKMLGLDNPAKNGFDDFQRYLKSILNK